MEDSYTFLYSFNFQPTPHGRFQLLRKLHLVFSLEDDTGTLDGQRCQLLCAWTPFFTENKYTDKAFYIKFPALEDLTLDFSDWELQDGEGVMVSRDMSFPSPCSFQRHRRQCLMSVFSPPLATGLSCSGRRRRAGLLLTSRTLEANEILQVSFIPLISLYSLTCPDHASHLSIQPLSTTQEAQSDWVTLPKVGQAVERRAPRRGR